MKLSVIIPAYNEIDTIAQVLDNVRAVDIEKEIIVADDFSTDGTRDFVRTQPDVKLVENPRNLGKGAAIRAAIEQVTGDIVLIQDADLEYAPRTTPSSSGLSSMARLIWSTAPGLPARNLR